MGNYLKYAEFGKYSYNQRDVRQHAGTKNNTHITEQSTPKEMATFVTKKLVDFIKHDLAAKNEAKAHIEPKNEHQV